MNLDNIKELSGLSPEQQELALKMLKEYSTTGESSTYLNIIEDDYDEMPVDIDTFITDPEYLGKAWMDSNGNCKMYPFWRDVLKKIFPDQFKTSINNVIESGARGLGKSEIGITIGLYLLHRILCMKNPNEYFGLKPTEKIAFAFMNITKILAEEIGIAKFQATVQMSPWFLKHGTLTGRGNIMWNPPDNIHIIVGSQASHVIGQPIYFAMFDEISFIRNQDIDKQKRIAEDMMDTAIGGMKTRFIHKGNNPTVLVLASSKRSDKSFLEEHMKKKLAEDHEGTFIVDEPVWNVKPADTYSGKKFLVGVGNRFLSSEILPEGANKKEYIDKGYNVIEVPIEFYTDFSDNIDRALCDFAGISSSELTKYISGQRWDNIKANYKNPFIKDIITVGNAPDDTAEYYDFIDLSRLNQEDMERPLYVHLDMSKSGDKTGIAGVWIMGKKPDKDGLPGDMYYKLAFSTSVKASKGYQISMEKNRHFVYWLKDYGFNLKGITTDTFQNVAIEQDLTAKGYPYSILSVDRVDTDKVCKPYQYFKNTIYEKRVSIYDCELLTQEALQLERNSNTGKVDHPDGESKDQCDAFCGAMYNASLHSAEYSFEFGESLDIATEVNNSQISSVENDRKQVEYDMEELLKGIYAPQEDSSGFVDFGQGKAKALVDDFYMISNGIVF